MKSGRWEPVELQMWRGREEKASVVAREFRDMNEISGIRIVSREFPDGTNGANANLAIIKTERLPDGRTKTIFKDKATGRIIEKIG